MHNRLDFVTLQAQLNARLDPSSIELDGRDLRDRLAFVADFSDLILFFDEQNQVAGDWRSIVLKDPVILLAVISKTSYQSLYFRFNQIQQPLTQIRRSLNEQGANSTFQEQGSHSISQLLLILDEIFDVINSWVRYLDLSSMSFDLRDFITQQVAGPVGQSLWQRVSLQEYLASQLSSVVPRPSSTRYNDFEPCWVKQKRLTSTINVENPIDALLGLEQIYHQVYRFFVQVIQSAKPAFYEMVVQRNDFPDTSLIIAVNQLIEYSQKLFNQYSTKHLNFYYKKLLRQKPAAPQPDYTYLCLNLDKSESVYELSKGTQFNAGAYADKSPVLFTSTAQTEINHIAFAGIYGMSYCDTDANVNEKQQYLQTFADSTKVRTGQSGQLLSSDWFARNAGDKVQQGFAIASEMLFLNAGQRTINITLCFVEEVSVADYQSADVSLSGEKGWLDIVLSTAKAVTTDTALPEAAIPPLMMPIATATWSQQDTKSLQLSIVLSPSFEAVTTFTKPDENYPLSMPYCKVMLPNSVDLQTPPHLTAIKFHVDVQECEQLAPSNDAGLLTNNKPMYPLGTRPSVDSHFYISAPEVFAKPVTQLSVRVDWFNLPNDFGVYYNAYNDFVDQNPTEDSTYKPFTNTVFTVNWAIKAPSGWSDIEVALGLPDDTLPPSTQASKKAMQGCHSVVAKSDGQQRLEPTLNLDTDTHSAAPDEHSTSNESSVEGASQTSNPPAQITDGLFAQSASSTNAPSSEFSFTGCPLVFASMDATSTPSIKTPSLRMTLSGPPQGFGEPLYPAVVNYVSLQNAKILMAAAGLLSPIVVLTRKVAQWFGSDAGKLKPMPEPPLQLQAKCISISYCAEQTIQFTQPMTPLKQGFALQHVGVWQNYIYFYQQAAEAQPSIDERHLKLQPSSQPDSSMALFQGVSTPSLGVYMQLKQVQPASRLSIFIELAQDIRSDGQSNNVAVYYWSTSGWQAVNILADETRALTRSGIIELDLPQDVAIDSAIWPKPQGKTNNTAWLMLTQDTLRQVQCVYCNTQAVKVQRSAPILLPVGTTPNIAAQQIKAPESKIAAITSLTQPFASMAGRAAENTSQFEQRVSLRLKAKNRACSDWDYCALARQSYSGIFYVKRLPRTHSGTVTLGVVQKYESAQQANAFNPVMSKAYQLQVADYLSARVSAMTQVNVCNLLHEPITVSAQLMVRTGININDLNAELIVGVNIYLAPWISATQPQYCLNTGLSKAGLAAYIAGFEEVEAIQQLVVERSPISSVATAGKSADTVQNVKSSAQDYAQTDIMSPSEQNSIFVPSGKHTFQFVRSGAQTQGVTAESAPLALPDNTMSEAGV